MGMKRALPQKGITSSIFSNVFKEKNSGKGWATLRVESRTKRRMTWGASPRTQAHSQGKVGAFSASAQHDFRITTFVPCSAIFPLRSSEPS